jgi:hypothetical protein
VDVLRGMRREGKHPLSKVPHLGDPELDNPPPIVPVSPSLAPESETVSVSEACEGTVDSSTIAAKGVEVTVEVTVAVAGAVDNVTRQVLDKSEETVSTGDSAPPPPVVIEPQREGESDKEYLVRTCR